MRRLLVIVAVLLLAVMAGWWWGIPGTGQSEPAPFLGYVEGDAIHTAAKAGGRIVSLDAKEGEDVAADAPLFKLDSESEEAAVSAAAAKLAEAKDQLADLEAAQQRPEEIAILEAERRQAAASLDLARTELERQRRLVAQKTAAQSSLDQAEMTFARDTAALGEAERRIEAGRLAARQGKVDAAKAAVAAAKAELDGAEKTLAERSVAAPAAGRISEVLYRVGEIVPAASPVVKILPPDRIEAWFYVPEGRIAALKPGAGVVLSCDGCPPGLSGTVRFIAPEAEFTPPVIFSRQERAKLVFLVKAAIDRPDAVAPGLPIEVRPR
ncbi:HlyD family secretion protein [Consotaella salsifontis]|uniref:HlyD family secretion protein n=1 Tax=Consotaella salsifontis TaxID=1365950 RepID=A0A1T4QQK3_9HYPH|nr:HlyD family efflux transporter periplasmic adaptor subunit [Consotaella salsifontis]SKA05964.1 HlyD family secretion protein [Consotaella salsifontis]